jgi:subtilisin family serine protease
MVEPIKRVWNALAAVIGYGQGSGGAAGPVLVPLKLLKTYASASLTGDLRMLRSLGEVASAMDPRLQLAVVNQRAGKPGAALALAEPAEISVIARVADPEHWANLPDVSPGAVMGPAAGGGWVVTGRIPAATAQTVHASETVLSLKAAEPLRPALGATLTALEIGSRDASTAQGVSPDGGAGVVVGVVDFGCDFAHANFRETGGETRIERIWYQAGPSRADSPFGYGQVFTSAVIDAALQKKNPYQALGYGPSPDSGAEIGAHGTHVMDIAAGNGLGSGQAGVAPRAAIIFVEARASAPPSPDEPGSATDFSQSPQLLDAVRFIFDEAGTRPCVVNVSLGANGGPHDGSSLVEQGLDAMVREKPNRGIVIAAGNAQLAGLHTHGSVEPGEETRLVWNQSGGAGGAVQIWYAGAERLEVTLESEDGSAFGPVAARANLSMGENGSAVLFISNRLQEPNNSDNMIWICLGSGLPGNHWTIRLSTTGERAVAYHAWIERNDGAQSQFANSTETHTLASISTGHDTIVVGAYDAHKAAMPIWSLSSTGPTRDGRLKPELSAPGQNVLAARSRTQGAVRKSGTSMAAPAVAGLIALIYEEAHRQGSNLTIEDLRERLMASIGGPPPVLTAGGWDPAYGYGRARAPAAQGGAQEG